MNPDKPAMALVDYEFVREMSTVLQKGLKNGRQPGDWKDLPDTDDTRLNFESSLMRHFTDYKNGLDSRHLVCVSVNAMILWKRMRGDASSKGFWANFLKILNEYEGGGRK